MKALPLASQRLATHSAISPSFRVVGARTSNYEQHVRFTSCGPFGPETSSGSWAKKVVWNRRKPSPRLVPAWLSEGQGRHLRVGLEGVFPWGIKPGQGIPRSRAFRRRCVPFKPGQGILCSIRRHVMIRHTGSTLPLASFTLIPLGPLGPLGPLCWHERVSRHRVPEPPAERPLEAQGRKQSTDPRG